MASLTNDQWIIIAIIFGVGLLMGLTLRLAGLNQGLTVDGGCTQVGRSQGDGHR